jgi:arylsulfatase A-like enzyme
VHPRQEKTLDRRAFLKKGLVAGGLLAGSGLGVVKLAEATEGTEAIRSAPSVARTRRTARSRRPNVLVIVVDQLRYPQWFSPGPPGPRLPPNLERLRRGAVCFAGHYTAANDCTPSRSALLTGLYSHQTGCMITGGSTLDPGFPTWGAMLREYGYHTRWYGKWHLTHRDHRWGPRWGERALERYGFSGGTFPSPDGAPGQGWRVDGRIAAQFADWYAHEGRAEPWCTTVSFVNPHDIAWWYRWSERVPAEASAAQVVSRLPPNFETPELLRERNKPLLQRSLQDTAAASFGPVPFTGLEAVEMWTGFLNLYVKLQLEVDRHIGRVLHALHSQPDVAAKTVVLFTSDHGEYGASHGLRGKGAGAYEEAIRVPLIVNDPRGLLTRSPERLRRQLTSSVDIAPLLLTIATGSGSWRHEPRHAHLADRLDLAAILADPGAPGRPYVLHATDETVTEYAIERYAANAPLHVVAMRTPAAKYATYSHWKEGGIDRMSSGEERELYDYGTDGGLLELHNGVGESGAEDELRSDLEQAIRQELRRPLPSYLTGAQARGFSDYYSVATRAADSATARRRRLLEADARAIETRAGERPDRSAPDLRASPSQTPR